MQPGHVLTAFVAALALSSAAWAAVDVTAAAQTPPKAKGAHVRVMTMGEFGNHPQWPGAVKARFKKVNDKGGVKDAAGVRHKVDVIVCDAKSDPLETEACARKAVDKGVAAVVGMTVINGDRALSPLEAAGIPVIGSRVNTTADVTSRVSFPLGSGMVGVLSAMPQLLAKQGARKIGVIVSDFGDATNSVVTLIQSGVSLTAASLGPVVRVPLNATNIAPYVASGTADGVNGVVSFLAGHTEGTLVQELNNKGFAGKTVTQASLVTDYLLGSVGPASEGVLAVGEFAPVTAKVPGIKRFRADMLDYDANLTFDEGALSFWLAAWVFERVARNLPTIDAASVLDAAGKVENLDMGGITPPLSTSVKNPSFPRLFNPTVTFTRVKDGSIVAVAKRFFDPLGGQFVS